MMHSTCSLSVKIVYKADVRSNAIIAMVGFHSCSHATPVDFVANMHVKSSKLLF